MDDVATKRDLNELGTQLRGEMSELRTELRGEMGELRTELGEVEARLTYQIGDSASRLANVIIERLGDLIKPVDDKASQALAEARAGSAHLAAHERDPDAHRS